ncbi:MAG: hypothetical protein AB1450_13330 [Pseudomonadota bacterium]
MSAWYMAMAWYWTGWLVCLIPVSDDTDPWWAWWALWALCLAAGMLWPLTIGAVLWEKQRRKKTS